MIDENFLVFLRSRDALAAERYLENQTTAKTLCRDPWSATVWWLKQEYDNTEEYREDLQKKREYKQHELESLQRALEVARSRPVSSVPTGQFSVPECKERHPLVDITHIDIQRRSDEHCKVCFDPRATLVKFCCECDEGVCDKCIDAFHPEQDIGFLCFLISRNFRVSIVYREKVNKTKPAKRARYTDERMKTSFEYVEDDVRRLRNEYYGTADHQTDIEKLIVETKAKIQSVNDRLQLSIDKAKAVQGTANDAQKRGKAWMCAVM